ncbi:diaminopimelate epimerase [Paucihalobacter ruber]|uniref:Diaminopimelate epimerase n=1 Tax=Paucihalobacter ruber TaxID=2567861 RepID=A0A506PFU0_9FLAO|nr:diaminopimelate epimerase [Paucihalobacter ruber]TPV32265.1 diaminopimelate epimerase [Paucihalobacter ruber]
MKLTFYKYQGTGNDFIIVDNRLFKIGKNDTKKIAHWCDRRFGIGADGFIMLENHPKYDFRMVYFNADGNESSMCGNGGRCITAFAKYLKIIDNQTTFEAIDGLHEAQIDDNGIVSLKMQDVESINSNNDFTFLDTGSPHHVKMAENVSDINVKLDGAAIRYSDLYKANGCNINFVEQLSNNTFKVRTYERGVEDETFSCGTGVTAVALAMHANKKTTEQTVQLITEGGDLQVKFDSSGKGYHNIWLIGPAVQVFKGEIEW